MNKQRVVLRADASKQTGYGHFYRSLALANHLKDDFDCWFASYNEDEVFGFPSNFQFQNILNICYPLSLGPYDDIESFNNAFLQILSKDDIVVLDNYYYTLDFQKNIRDKGCKLVCIDDIPHKSFSCDLLITGSPLQRKDFKLEKNTDFRGGIEWVFLREAFMSPLFVRNERSKIQNIVIAMGGSDAFNITDKIIGIVRNIFPQGTIDIIAGDTVSVKHQGMKGITVHRNLSADDIVKLYDRSDIGFFPSSTVAVEALSRNLPVFAGHYASNQRVLYNWGVNKGYFSPMGNLLEQDYQIEDRIMRVLSQNLPTTQLICFQNQRQQTVKLFKKL